MQIDAVLLPSDLRPGQLAGRTVIVFDVLRATTTMTAALEAGVSEIRIFGDLESARSAWAGFGGPKLLCGEANAVRPAGFDLGNSPGAFRREEHAGRTVFMSTTNGTRAILAAHEAADRFTGALVNAAAVAKAAAAGGRDVTLLCSGTAGRVSIEDVLGCGAVLTALLDGNPQATAVGDVARIARRLFADNRQRLAEVMADGDGGRNVTAARLVPDIAFCARLDAATTVGRVTAGPNGPAVHLWHG